MYEYVANAGSLRKSSGWAADPPQGPGRLGDRALGTTWIPESTLVVFKCVLSFLWGLITQQWTTDSGSVNVVGRVNKGLGSELGPLWTPLTPPAHYTLLFLSSSSLNLVYPENS